jgi:hypothetical protein
VCSAVIATHRVGVDAAVDYGPAGMPGHAAFAQRMRGFLKFVAGDFAGARRS